MDLLLLYRGLKPDDPDYGAEVRETPLGLYNVAAAVKSWGFEVELINTSYLSEHREDLLLESLETPVLIGLSQTTVNRHAVYYLVKKLKKKFPSTPVVIGGIHASLFAEQLMSKHPDIDYVIVGEGEKPAVQLVDTLKRGDDVLHIPGLGFRKEENVIINPPPIPIQLDDIPAPIDYYRVKYFQSTRGCPYRCSYCSTNAIFRDSLRIQSIDRLMNSIGNALTVHNMTHISFADDLFFLDKKRLLDFSEAVGKLKFHFTYNCNLRVNAVDEETIVALVRSGCTRVMFGVESASQTILDLYNKKINKEQIVNAVQLCRKYCLQVGLSFISCGQYDNEVTFGETIQLIDFLKPTDIITNSLYLYPGSQLYHQAVSEGSLDPGIWESNSTPLPSEAYAGYPEFHKQSFLFARRIEDHYRRKEYEYQFTTNELEEAWQSYRYPVTGLKLASRYFKEKQFEHAERLFDELIDAGYNLVDVVRGKAFVLLERNMSREALALLFEAEKSYPKSRSLHLALGSIYERVGDVEKAIRHYSHAYRYDDNPGQLLLKMGFMFEKKGKHSQALDTYRKLKEDCVIYSPNMKQFLNIKIKQLETLE